MAKRYFVCTTAGHNKFWNTDVEQSGTVQTVYLFIVWYGKRFTEGVKQIKEFGTRYQAEDLMHKKIKEKLDKGYVEVFPAATAPTPAAPPKQKLPHIPLPAPQVVPFAETLPYNDDAPKKAILSINPAKDVKPAPIDDEFAFLDILEM